MSNQPQKSSGLRCSQSLVSICAASVMCAMVPAAAIAGGGGGAYAPSTAVKFEPVPGTNLKRVILTARAEQRIGLKTAKISQKPIILSQVYGGQVTDSIRIQQKPLAGAPFGEIRVVSLKDAKPPIPLQATLQSGGAWISLEVSEDEWKRVDKSKPALISTLATRDNSNKAVEARLANIAPVFDPKRTMLTVYYLVTGKDHGLTLNDRIRAKLSLAGSGSTEKVIPYGALYYDGKGVPWVYVKTKPLTFERKRVVVDRYVGDDVVIKDGLPLGTEVVSVGASLLFGAEVIYKR